MVNPLNEIKKLLKNLNKQIHKAEDYILDRLDEHKGIDKQAEDFLDNLGKGFDNVGNIILNSPNQGVKNTFKGVQYAFKQTAEDIGLKEKSAGGKFIEIVKKSFGLLYEAMNELVLEVEKAFASKEQSHTKKHRQDKHKDDPKHPKKPDHTPHKPSLRGRSKGS